MGDNNQFYSGVDEMKTKKTALIVSALVLSAGIALIIAGIIRGEARTVFEKAIRICLECIGIG